MDFPIYPTRLLAFIIFWKISLIMKTRTRLLDTEDYFFFEDYSPDYFFLNSPHPGLTRTPHLLILANFNFSNCMIFRIMLSFKGI